MKFLAKCTLAALAILAVALAPDRAEYPERNITVIMPFPAGGASDITARLIAPKLSERFKQTVIIDNRAGANGSLGAVALKQAPADGYTLLPQICEARCQEAPQAAGAEPIKNLWCKGTLAVSTY